jgi:hypothetical protein
LIFFSLNGELKAQGARAAKRPRNRLRFGPRAASEKLEESESELGLDGFEDGVRLGELSRLQFGIYLLPIDANFEGAPTGRDQVQRTDSLFECQKFFRQTDGFWFVVSSRAVLDCYFRTHIRLRFGFGKTVGKAGSNVKSSRPTNSKFSFRCWLQASDFGLLSAFGFAP